MNKLIDFIKNNNLIFPNHKDLNIVDLMKCLYIRNGYKFKNNKNIDFFDSIIPTNKHYLFVLSDGTGSNLIDKLDNNSILKKNKKSDIYTVFPSTTGCVLTSMATAQYPEEHGIWGWYNYNRDLKRDYYPVLFMDRKSEKNLKDFNIKENDIYKSESILKKLKVKTNILFPNYICDSIYSKFVGYDKDRYSYNDFKEIVNIINYICESNEFSYTYLYLPDIDSIEHKNGVNADKTLKKILEIEALIKEISKIKNMTIVFTADHGQNEISEDIIFNFKKYDKFFYAYPSIDFGTASYYVKEEYKEKFEKEFENDFKNKMFLFKTEEFIQNKMFGEGSISKYASDNLGEYISLCKNGSYLINTLNTDDYLGKIKGNHSGLTPDEMIIPLTIIDTNDFN